MSYLENNHPHHKEPQTAGNPVDDRRSAQRCWAKVCRDIDVGVRPKCGKKHDSQIPAASAFFPGIFSKDLQRGRSSHVNGALVGCWCKELPFIKFGSFSTTLFMLSWLVFWSLRLPICVHVYAYTAYLDIAVYLFIS